MPRKIEISYKTIIFVAALWIFLWFVYSIRDLLVMVFFSFVIMFAINPLVDTLQKIRLPRSLSIGLIFILLWVVVGLAVAGLVPPLVEQTGNLIARLPNAVAKIEILNSHQQEITQQLISQISSLPQNVFKITLDLFGNIINVITTLVISFYLLVERKNFSKQLGLLFGEDKSRWMSDILNRIERNLGGWLRGELVLMFSVGVMTYLGLLLLGVESALSLAILAGVLEIIPNLGPIISSIPSILVALTVSPALALGTAALYWLVQLIENNFLVPKVMSSAVGVNPVVVILGLMTGFRLNGPLGAVMAIPVIIILKILLSDLYKSRV
ncbi:MAG: AI-2E family transporter [Patescibacteria group bacterium]